MNLYEVGFDYAVHLQQGEHRLVLVVGEQLALLGQTHGVDAVRFEYADGGIGHGRGNHQRQEQVVATGQLGSKEDGHERRVHDGRHDPGHTHQGKVLVRQLHGQNARVVEHIGKEEAREAAHVQAGGECTTHTASAVGGTGGQYLHQNDEGEEEHHHPHVVVFGIEEATLGQLLQVVVQQAGDGSVALAVERWQQEDGETEDGRPEEKLFPRRAYLAEDVLHAGHHAGKVERDESAEDAQQNHVGDTGRLESLGLHETELGTVAREDVRHRHRRNRRDEQRQHRGGGHVDHQHLEGKQDTGNRGLEYAGNGSSRAAAYQQHEQPLVQAEEAPDVRPDGRAGVYDRGLGSYRTAEPDGNRTGNHRGVHVVRFQPAFLLRDGIEDAGDTVADVVLDDVAHIEPRQQDTDNRVDEVEVVGAVGVEVRGEQVLDKVDEKFQNQCGGGRADTDYETQKQHEVVFVDVLLAPQQQAQHQVVPFPLLRGVVYFNIFFVYHISFLLHVTCLCR